MSIKFEIVVSTKSRGSRTEFRARLVAAGFLVMGLTGTVASAETLEEAMVSAYNSNPTLLAERAGLKATSENIWQAQAGWLPSITLQGSVAQQDTIRQPGDVVTEAETKSGTVTVSQPIFRGGQTLYGTRSANAQTRAAEARLVSVEQEVLFGAARSYYDVLRDISVVELSKNNVQVLERQLQAAQDRFRVGEITRTDVAQAEARLSGSHSRLIQSEAALTASRSAYERTMGHLPQDMGAIETLPEIAALPGSEAEAITIALASNPVLIASRDMERASGDAVKATRGRLLPQISVEASYGYRSDIGGIFGDTEGETTTITGRVTVPLFQGGANYSRIRQAKQTNSQNRIQIAETERAIREGVVNAWEGLRSAKATIVSSEQQVRANEIAFNGVRQEAQVGSRTTLDVLNAEQELLDARVTLVRARRDEFVAAYALLSTVGRLTARDLRLPVTLYRP